MVWTSLVVNTTVVNIHKTKEYDVYIGRAGKDQDGTWGNPFSKGTREENIAAYRVWIREQPHLLDRLCELKGKTLGCFCKQPNREVACHGDVLVELINEYCGNNDT
jgi:hypothetical protein